MKTYGQYCPVARALEVVGDRWSLLIVRDLLLGDRGFNELERGLPGISRSLLAQRLRLLERGGVVRAGARRGRPGPGLRPHRGRPRAGPPHRRRAHLGRTMGVRRPAAGRDRSGVAPDVDAAPAQARGASQAADRRRISRARRTPADRLARARSARRKRSVSQRSGLSGRSRGFRRGPRPLPRLAGAAPARRGRAARPLRDRGRSRARPRVSRLVRVAAGSAAGAPSDVRESRRRARRREVVMKSARLRIFAVAVFACALAAAPVARPGGAPSRSRRRRTVRRRELSGLLPRRRPADVHSRRRAAPLVRLRGVPHFLSGGREGRSRLRHGVLGDRHDLLPSALGAARPPRSSRPAVPRPRKAAAIGGKTEREAAFIAAIGAFYRDSERDAARAARAGLPPRHGGRRAPIPRRPRGRDLLSRSRSWARRRRRTPRTRTRRRRRRSSTPSCRSSRGIPASRTT